MSTDSVNLIQTGDAVDVVELAEPGVILETAGGVAGGTIGFGPGGTTGQVWGKVSGTDYDADWIDGGSGGGVTEADVIQLRQKASLEALRHWNYNAAKFSTGGQGDVLILGDSISEGWYGNPLYELTWVGRFATNLARALNDKGRIGRWVAAGGGFYPTPHFSANGGAETERNYGITLRSRRMNVGAATVTMAAGITSDRVRVHYLKANVFAQADLHFVVKDGSGTIVADSGSIYTYDGGLAANAYKENVWDSGALTRDTYTLEVTRETHGAYTGYAEWVGAYFYDGDYSAGHRVWNGSHYGYSTSTFVANQAAWRDPIQSGYLTPALVISALGVNDRGSGAATWKSNTETLFGYVRTDLAARAVQPASFVILLPMAAATTSDATWEAFRTAAYEIAAAATDVDVWEWDELYGPVDSVDGDPLGITIDNTHPVTTGHLMLGQYAARQALQGIEGRGVEKVWAARGVADGFATLDTAATLPTAQLPTIPWASMAATGNPAVQSAAAGTVAVTITGAVGQTADLIRGVASGVNVFRVGAGGTLLVNAPAATPGTVQRIGVNAWTTTDNAAAVILSSGGTNSTKPLVVQGRNGQTGNLTEWQAHDGTVLASISAAGVAALASGSTVGGSAIVTVSALASIATSGSASDLGSGTIPAGRFGNTTVPIAAINASGTPSSANFLRGDGAWSTATDSGAVPKSTVTAKGDLIVATASGTVTNRAVGSNGQALVAESGNSDGLMWADVIPWHQHIMLGDGIYKSAVGTWAVAASSVVAGAQFNNAASQAVNDELQYDVVLSEGTWSLSVTHGKTATAGIMTWYLDSTSLGTIDAYNGSATNNNVSTISSISVSTTGRYVLKMKLESKNASASAYRATLQQLTLRRTA